MGGGLANQPPTQDADLPPPGCRPPSLHGCRPLPSMEVDPTEADLPPPWMQTPHPSGCRSPPPVNRQTGVKHYLDAKLRLLALIYHTAYLLLLCHEGDVLSNQLNCLQDAAGGDASTTLYSWEPFTTWINPLLPNDNWLLNNIGKIHALLFEWRFNFRSEKVCPVSPKLAHVLRR